MTRDLLIRGFDNKIHLQLGELSKEKGVSINSIVKDAVDKWLNQQQQSDIPKKHYLLLYSDDNSILGLLKSMDRLAKESDLFRCFCGPPSSISTKLLSKLNWYDGTVTPYCYDETTTVKTILTNIISLINCSHQIFYNIQIEYCIPVVTTNIVFKSNK